MCVFFVVEEVGEAVCGGEWWEEGGGCVSMDGWYVGKMKSVGTISRIEGKKEKKRLTRVQ